MQEIIGQIKNLIQPILGQEQVELVDLIYRSEAGRYVLRLLVDKQGGISLEDCVRINRTLSDLLDKSDLIQQSFALEVNSPGLDRPFVAKRDFERNLGKLVKLIVKNPRGATDTIVGKIKTICEDKVVLDIKGSEAGFLFEEIIKAKLETEWRRPV